MLDKTDERKKLYDFRKYKHERLQPLNNDTIINMKTTTEQLRWERLKELSVVQARIQCTTKAVSSTVHTEYRQFCKRQQTANCEVEAVSVKCELNYGMAVK